MKILKYTFIPFLLTILGLFINDTCGDVICLFPGRGFPLGYYSNHEFYILFFLIDLIIISLIYTLILKIFHSIKLRKNKIL